MKPSLEDMQVFLTVTESGSFTSAAETLGKTKSAVSQCVTRLENDLGARLLLRTTRALSLTESGIKLINHCKDIRQAYESALSEVKDIPRGVLTITAPNALSNTLINPVIKDYLELFGDMEVRLISDDSPIDLVTLNVDIAIRVGKLEQLSLKVSKLGVITESLYAAPDYITKMGGVPDPLKALEHWHHITSEWQGNPISYVLGDGQTFKAKPKIRCNALQDVIDLTIKGLGVARLPDLSVENYLASGQLQTITTVAKTEVHYMHPFSKSPPIKVKEFVKLLKNRL